MGDPGDRADPGRRGAAGRSDRDVDARPPVPLRRPARRHRRPRPASGEGPGPAPPRAVAAGREPDLSNLQNALRPPRPPPLCYKVLDAGRRPPALHAHAADNLRFIRDTMERAGAVHGGAGLGRRADGRHGDRRRGHRRSARQRSRAGCRLARRRGCRRARSRSSRSSRKARRRRRRSPSAPAHRFALAYRAAARRRGGAHAGVRAARAHRRSCRGAGCCSTAPRSRPAARSRCASCRSWASCFMALGVAAFAAPAAWGQLLHGRRLRRPSHRLRADDCEEIWWVERADESRSHESRAASHEATQPPATGHRRSEHAAADR